MAGQAPASSVIPHRSRKRIASSTAEAPLGQLAPTVAVRAASAPNSPATECASAAASALCTPRDKADAEHSRRSWGELASAAWVVDAIDNADIVVLAVRRALGAAREVIDTNRDSPDGKIVVAPSKAHGRERPAGYASAWDAVCRAAAARYEDLRHSRPRALATADHHVAVR